MSQIRSAVLSYSTSNLGDDLQTVAALPFLPPPTHSFDRDTLALQQSEDAYIILMNAWWADNPENAFPPASCFLPVFIGFHISSAAVSYFSKPHCVAYLKARCPIGCRDLFTMNLLQQWGVEAFFSGCLTTTFEKREKEPVAGKVILVDTARVNYLIPASLKKDAMVLTHSFNGNPDTREKAVYDLLNLYRTTASLVITARLHAALTCSALGIPVVFFFQPEDPRVSTAAQIGLPIYPYLLNHPAWLIKFLKKLRLFTLWIHYEELYFGLQYRFKKQINWTPGPLDFENHKSGLRAKTIAMIGAIRQCSDQSKVSK